MNSNLLIIIKDKAYETMAIIGIAVSFNYVMRYLGFDGHGIIPYGSYWSLALGWFIGLVLKAYYNKQN